MNSSSCYDEPTHEEIALRAFLTWEKEGRQPGRESTYWLQAESEIRSLRQKKAEAAAAQAARPWRPEPSASRLKAGKPPTATRSATKAKLPETRKPAATVERATALKFTPSAKAASSRTPRRTAFKSTR
jgi:hypothetical protein